MPTKRIARCFALAVTLATAACSDKQPTGPSPMPPQQPQHNAMLGFYNGVEYELDTGEVACPAILNSNVKYWVNINAVGPRLFTFFAPHVRQTYLGGGVYRFRMTLGRSDDNQWLAEGPWTGKCYGYSQWGIGRVLSFEGTVWRTNLAVGSGSGCGKESYYETSYDPYLPEPCEGEGDGSGGGGGDDGGNSGYSCTWEYITIEASYDGGATWEDFWSGWAKVCDSAT